MRNLPKLLIALCALICPALASAQTGVRWDGLTISPSGKPVSASVAVCNSPGLATTAAQVIGNTAILTFGSSPITAGFAANMPIAVSGFTGGDVFFNVGTLQPFSSTVTISAVSATTITFPLTHANASASSNGSVFQMGNIATSCAPLASIFSDWFLAVPIVQPGLVSSNIGNVGFYVNPGAYAIQFYGTGITTYLQPLTLTMLFYPGMNSNPGVFTNTQMNQYFGSNINSVNFQTEYQFDQTAANFGTFGATFGAATPSNATANGIFGLGSFVTSACNSLSRTTCNTVAGYFHARGTANGAGVWTHNGVVADAAGTTGTNLIGDEIDVTVHGAPSFIVGYNAVICAGCGSDLTQGTVPSSAHAFIASKVSGQPAQWKNGFVVDRGSTSLNGFLLDGLNVTAGTASNKVTFRGYDGGNASHDGTINADQNGTLILSISNVLQGSQCFSLANNGSCPAFAAITGGKIYFGDVTLAAGTSTVNNLPFTNSTSFRCATSDATATNAVRVTVNSGSQITINGTGTDVVSFICGGS